MLIEQSLDQRDFNIYNLLQHQSETVTKRILRDMTDGVMMISNDGTINFVNNSALDILGRQSVNLIGEKYTSVFLDREENDGFNQLILDSIYDQENAHSGVAKYHHGDAVYSLQLTTSFLYDETTHTKTGVIAVFKDITELERLNQLKQESTLLFSLLMIAVGIYTFIWQIIAGKISDGTIPSYVMTRIIELIAIVLFVIAITKTSITMKDLGLFASKKQLLRSLLVSGLIATALVGLMFTVKVLLTLTGIQINAGQPFWDWHRVNLSTYTYFLVAPIQEFLARGVMQGTLDRIVSTKTGMLAILLSTVIFGVLHACYGIAMMVFASLLSFGLGFLYNKQKNIWGCSVIHWAIGIAGGFLGFIR